MVRIDRVSGKRVFDGWPTDDPRASVIWEAFKPDTEPRRSHRQDATDALRELVLAQLRRGTNSGQGGGDEVPDEAPPSDFAEEQGGLY
jgi:penicillin-binding protein 1A